MSTREKNRQKLSELEPRVQYAAFRWNDECHDTGHPFAVREVYRPQSRQNKLYAQGRTTKGNIVTWTLDSFHTKRLACDVAPDDGDFEALAVIGKKYGITHPLAFDLWHFEFDQVPNEKIILSVEARISALGRALERSLRRGLVGTSNVIRATLERLKRRS